MSGREDELETRDAVRARLLMATRRQLVGCEQRLEREHEMRVEAERERDKFHALLIQERIRKIPERTS